MTNRCHQERFFILPSAKINELVMYWLTRTMSRYGGGIELYAFAFLSNHFHLLLRDKLGQLAKFMCYFQGNVARAINQELGRSGKFWSREYDDMLVDGDAEFPNRWTYTTCNAVKANLVERAAQWQGATSLEASLTGLGYDVKVVNHQRLRSDKRRGMKVKAVDYEENFTLRVSHPPQLANLSKDDRREYYEELVHSAEERYAAQREKPVLGLKRIALQSPFDRPDEPARRPRVRILCFDRERRKELYATYRLFFDGYKATLDGFFKAAVAGRRPAVEWPPYSYPPSMWTPIGYANTASNAA